MEDLATRKRERDTEEDDLLLQELLWRLRRDRDNAIARDQAWTQSVCLRKERNQGQGGIYYCQWLEEQITEAGNDTNETKQFWDGYIKATEDYYNSGDEKEETKRQRRQLNEP